MHVALTGASGFIGAAVARDLHAQGHTVTALVRETSRRDHVDPFVDRFVVGDQADRSAWPALLEGADCVVHSAVDWRALKAGDLAAHYDGNVLASLELIEAAGDRQFIFMSTIAVHHDMRPRWNGVVDEDHPTRPGMRYGAAKAAVEAHLWSAHFERGMSTCALRPCAVYGLDPRLARSIGHPIVRDVRNSAAYPRPGGGKFVHVDDVAAATVAAVGNPDAAGTVFNLVDCYARWSDWARLAGELLGVDVEVDTSSPAAPKNMFTKDAVRDTLGVQLDRGHAGIRSHLASLIEAMDAVPAEPSP